MTHETRVRMDWEEFRNRTSDLAIRSKQSQDAIFALIERYRLLTPEERDIVDGLLAEHALSDDSLKRFDALALVDEFNIVSALPALRELERRTENATGPSAPYDWAKVNRIIGKLSEVNNDR